MNREERRKNRKVVRGVKIYCQCGARSRAYVEYDEKTGDQVAILKCPACGKVKEAFRSRFDEEPV